MNHLKILIADDSEFNRFLIEQMLADLNYQITFVSNGAEAIEEFAKTTDFDFVILDIEMPEMNGFETAKHIRTQFPSTEFLPIIALTAHTEKELIYNIFKNGFTDVLIKPFSTDEFKDIIEKHSNLQTKGNNKKKETKSVSYTFKTLDLSKLKEFSHGDKGFEVEIIQMFITDSGRTISKIRDFYKNNNREGIKENAHKFGSHLAFLDIKLIEPDVNLIENYACNSEKFCEIPEITDRIEKKLTKVIEELENYIQTLIKK